MPSAPYNRLGQEDEAEPTSFAHSLPDDVHARPAVYYGDGPFDAPSSDDESEGFLEKPGRISPGSAERGRGEVETEDGLHLGGTRQVCSRWSSVRWLLVALGVLVASAAIIGMFAAFSYTGPTRIVRGNEHITMDHVFNGTFSASRTSLAWVPEAGDGVYSIYDNGKIELVDLKTNTTTKLLSVSDVTDEQGNALTWASWKLSPDMKYVLVKSDWVKQWRWSSFGNFYVHNIETKETHPLIPPSHPPVTAYATWLPTGQSIAYVANNDLYVAPSPSPGSEHIPITNSGNATLFHGVPDWVYEEEIFGNDYTLWWSPDSRKLAFLVFDETLVDEFSFPIYNPTPDNNAVNPYTEQVVMRYPKPGYNNPVVSTHVFDVERYLSESAMLGDFSPSEATLELDWQGKLPANDSIIMEVAWLGNKSLILKEVNRNSDAGSVVHFDLEDTQGLNANMGHVVRKLGKSGEQGDDGWIDAEHTIYPLPASLSPDIPAYLDIVPSKDGYNHIALFIPADSSTPRFLTSGKWEVTSGVQAIDPERRLVYFQAANPSSTERHIYSISLPARLDDKEETLAELTALTDTSTPAKYSASFSPKAGFHLLSYDGPNIPWQKVINSNDSDWGYVLTNNVKLNETWNRFEMPIVQYSTIESDGHELNAVELRPPHMDDSGRTKYPVLFRVYGGPNSQMVDQKYGVDWHYYLACSLEYIVVIVDGRGTGLKGRQFRNPVKGNLGYWETKDQIEAARVWASKNYVDPKRIGIWGWSYGGYMSAKVVEADAGIHSLAMAVAPPTDWRMYDSIYTERYMNIPQLNAEGYHNSSVSNVTAFDKVNFLLAHGTGDDNVHFANSAHLLDMFTKARIRNYRFRMFTDSDHGISKRGAYQELHEWMTGFLVEKWGKGGRRRGW
ncbi:dipeptidyl aminopeptidase [Amylostereum chailletii]|nr:dipeptidyl aminopeptidase [Amylostereum chailletii]